MYSSGAESRIVSVLRELSPSERKALYLKPEAVLGAYEELSPSDRASLCSAVEAWDEISTRGYRAPGFWPSVQLLWRLRALGERIWGEGLPLGRSLFDLANTMVFASRQAPAWAGRAAHRAAQMAGARWARTHTDDAPILGFLARRRVSPYFLAACYCRSIRQQRRYRAFWNDPKSNQTVGCILGLDFAPARDGFYLLESNLEPAQRIERSELYERDPFAENLVEHAVDRGFEHLFILDNRHDGVNPNTAIAYQELASEAGLSLSIIDRAHLPNSSHRRSFGIPEDIPYGSLVARLKSYPVSSDFILADKLATHRVLSKYKQAFDEPDLHLPKAGIEPVFGEQDADSPFPNMVVKQSDSGQGKRISFAKVRSSHHAKTLFGQDVQSKVGDASKIDRIKGYLEAPASIFQEYVRPVLLKDNRPYIVRAHVLITPEDVAYLSSHRVVSNQPVPSALSWGIVENPDPYIVNYSASSRYGVVPEEEEQFVKRATLAVGRGLAWTLRYAFQVEPDASA